MSKKKVCQCLVFPFWVLVIFGLGFGVGCWYWSRQNPLIRPDQLSTVENGENYLPQSDQPPTVGNDRDDQDVECFSCETDITEHISYLMEHNCFNWQEIGKIQTCKSASKHCIAIEQTKFGKFELR